MRRFPLPIFVLLLLTFPLACTRAPSESRGGDVQPLTSARISIATRPTTAPARSIEEAVTYLASDTLEGRGVGTNGINLAADYIASRFEEAGLRPVPGQPTFFQNFEMTTGASIDSSSFLKSGATSLILGKEYTPASFSAEKKFEASSVFIGYGISAAGDPFAYDDYAGVDVKDKVAIAMRFEPHDAAGKSRFQKDTWSPRATLIEKAKTAAAHGAVALILVTPPTYHGDGDDLMPFARQFLGQPAPIPVFQVARSIVDSALKQGGAPDLKAIQSQIDESGKPASRVLNGAAFSGELKLDRKTSKVKNIVACLPGSGPHADEYVVIGAHYDHLGRGGPGALGPRTGEIYNGADDNASGTAAMLAIADRLASRGPQARSILVIAFTAEESGLVGSNHFLEQPPVSLAQIVAMLNLDMVGRMKSDILYVGGNGTAPQFDAILKQADEDLPIQIKSIGRGGYGPSDHMSFAMKKIPVLFFFSGLHADYHRPTDKVAKINFAGIKETVDFGERVAVAMTKMEHAQYVDTFDASSSMMSLGSSTGGHAMLGVIPDYGTDTTTGGVRITGAMPHSPAAAAGLKDGDVITGFGDKNIGNLYDLSEALSSAKPGDKVTLRVVREGKTITLDATLAERKSSPTTEEAPATNRIVGHG